MALKSKSAQISSGWNVFYALKSIKLRILTVIHRFWCMPATLHPFTFGFTLPFQEQSVYFHIPYTESWFFPLTDINHTVLILSINWHKLEAVLIISITWHKSYFTTSFFESFRSSFEEKTCVGKEIPNSWSFMFTLSCWCYDAGRDHTLRRTNKS